MGWEAGGAGEPAPVPLCQLCSGDFGEKLKQMSGVMLSEATGARFAGAHLVPPHQLIIKSPFDNPS